MVVRRIAGIATIVVVAGVSFAAGGLYAALKPPEHLHVPLTDDLPDTREGATRTFDARLKTRFPIGSPLAELVKTLRSQGFVRDDWSDSTDDRHHAVRREDIFACNIAAQVFWRHDDAGKLTEVSGTYGEVGCL